MNVHSCIATTESGITLGLVHQETHAREKRKDEGRKASQAKSRANENKENFRWLNTAHVGEKQVTSVDPAMDCLLICDQEGTESNFVRKYSTSVALMKSLF